jgi:hypothetical protein
MARNEKAGAGGAGTWPAWGDISIAADQCSRAIAYVNQRRTRFAPKSPTLAHVASCRQWGRTPPRPRWYAHFASQAAVAKTSAQRGFYGKPGRMVPSRRKPARDARRNNRHLQHSLFSMSERRK